MSTLQVSNIHFESTGNNRIQYAGSNSVTIVAGGSNVASLNSSGFSISGGILANGASGSAGQTLISGGAGSNSYWGVGAGYAVQYFTANGTWTASNNGLKYIKVTISGAGGSGGKQAPPAPNPGSGGPGGDGGQGFKYFPAANFPQISSSVPVVIGLPVALINAEGSNSSFGTLLTATGGGGGGNGTTQGQKGATGTTGTTTPSPDIPIFNVQGEWTKYGYGSGGIDVPSPGPGPGAIGQQGVVVVEEFY